MMWIVVMEGRHRYQGDALRIIIEFNWMDNVLDAIKTPIAVASKQAIPQNRK